MRLATGASVQLSHIEVPDRSLHVVGHSIRIRIRQHGFGQGFGFLPQLGAALQERMKQVRRFGGRQAVEASQLRPSCGLCTRTGTVRILSLWRRRAQRVLPAQAGEAREIAVGRAEYESMLDRERGQVRVGHQIGATGRTRQQRSEQGAVTLGRGGYPDRFAIQPGLDLTPGRVDRKWPRMNARVGSDARTKARRLGQGSPTGALPFSRASSHARAAAWSGDAADRA